MTRQHHSTGAPWEQKVGYSRAVRVGDRILVAGTTAVDEEGSLMRKSAYEQAEYAFSKCLRAIDALGGSASDVVRTRMFVVNVEKHALDVGRAHKEALGDTMPVATMVGVSSLIDPRLLVEVEMEAVVS